MDWEYKKYRRVLDSKRDIIVSVFSLADKFRHDSRRFEYALYWSLGCIGYGLGHEGLGNGCYV